MPFQSLQQDIFVPRDLTTWQWLFESSTYSPAVRFPMDSLGGYTDVSSQESLNWSEVKAAATYISTSLVKQHGFVPGDTVSMFSQNSIWYGVVAHATTRIGGRVSGASPAYNAEEMTFALQKSHAKYLMTHPNSIAVALQAAERAKIPPNRVFLLEGRYGNHKTVKDLLEAGRREIEQAPYWTIPSGATNFDVCAFLSFSSGTTGLPKAVMIAHQNVIAQCLQIVQVTPKSLTRILAVLPCFHITGLVHILHFPVLINASVFMLPNFTMKNPIVDRYNLDSLERFSSGAAPLSEEIIQRLKNKFPKTGFKQGYGMTESCSCITVHPVSHYDYRYAHTVGRICASTTVKILKENGTEAGVNEPGEICAKGPQIVMGYLDDDKATRDTFCADGYLHTGDQGFIDEEGFITISDRIKELIKVKGIGVAPAELEDFLLGHSKVEDVAVVGIPDDYNGEVPKAYVVLKPGYRPSRSIGRELIRYVGENKIRHKAIREIEFVESIPKSASGKILRRILRDNHHQNSNNLVVREERSKL